MKTALDPRHKSRQEVVQSLFSYSFHTQQITNKKALAIVDNLSEIDKEIEIIAPEFPIDKINKVDLAILRLAVYELNYDKNVPPKVVIDEAIELAKEFGGENSPAFVNGALGKALKEEKAKEEQEATTEEEKTE